MNNLNWRLASLDAIFTPVVQQIYLIDGHDDNTNIRNQFHRSVFLRDGHPTYLAGPPH